LVTDFDTNTKLVGATVGQITGGTGAYAGERLRVGCVFQGSLVPFRFLLSCRSPLDQPSLRPFPFDPVPAGVKGVLSSSDYVDENGTIISYMSVVTDKDV
jgi:hypothetical protein